MEWKNTINRPQHRDDGYLELSDKDFRSIPS
jgi:hypothetical protein